MTILSIQSHVVSGHVGHQASVLPLQRLGFDVLALPSVLYSNHPGHGAFSGAPVEAGLMADLVSGLKTHSGLDKIRALHSGYLGSFEQVAIVRDLARSLQSETHPTPYFCDPVMGDREKGLYVDPALADAIKTALVPMAHAVFPNAVELECLTGQAPTNLDATLAAADTLLESGVAVVVATSLALDDQYPEGFCNLAVSREGAYLCAVPYLSGAPKGAGDLLAAVFMARCLKHEHLSSALSQAVTVTHRILELSIRAGARDLLIVEGQDHVINPGNRVAVTQVR